MYSTYRIKANEIDLNFLEGIKKMFQEREVEIVIQDIEDETEYLLKSSTNKRFLLEAIQNVEAGKNLVDVEIED